MVLLGEIKSEKNLNDFLYDLGEIHFTRVRNHDGYVEYGNAIGYFSALYSCFKNGDEKTAIVYAWALSFRDIIYIGRTREEFCKLTNMIELKYKLNPNRRLIIYDSNISYDFHSFFRTELTIIDVFAKAEYQPVKVVADGFEIRDLDILVGKRLSDETFYTSMVATPETELTYKEKEKLKYNAFISQEYILSQLEYYKNASRIPLTNTSRARKILKRLLRNTEYRNLVKSLTIEPDEMKLLKDTFTGGFVYCKEEYKNETLHYIGSFDISSSYLASCLAHKFPVSKGIQFLPISEKHIEEIEKNYLWIGYVYFKGLKPKHRFAFIDPSHCKLLKGEYFLGNKVLGATDLVIAVTNVDFALIRKYYDYDSVTFGRAYKYHKGYLPKELLETLLGFYKEKTELKDVESEKVNYTVKKAVLNASCFGLMVQDPVRARVSYNNFKWKTEPVDIETATENYNTNNARCLSYVWGVFVSSFSRMHLINTIGALYDDFVYSDTDSAKIYNVRENQPYFDKYNEWITACINHTCDMLQIDKSLTSPVTIYGEIKPLGVWEYEGEADTFKAIGEKRYIAKHGNKLKATVSGINSLGITEYLQTLDNAFEDFDEYITIPKEYARRNTIYLIKTQRKGTIKDREGIDRNYNEQYGAYFSASSYNLTLTDLETFGAMTSMKL